MAEDRGNIWTPTPFFTLGDSSAEPRAPPLPTGRQNNQAGNSGGSVSFPCGKKTKMCAYFYGPRSCMNDEEGCTYAHDPALLRLVVGGKMKSKICKFTRAGETCPKRSCDFDHTHQHICDFSVVGRECTFAAEGKCTFRHLF